MSEDEDLISRRHFLKAGVGLVGVLSGASAVFNMGGCSPQPPADERGLLYFNRRQDLLDSLRKADKGSRIIGEAILSASDKLARSLQPDYLSFKDVDKNLEALKTRAEKKILGVLEIYNVQSEGVAVFEAYWSELMTNSLMANLKIGENFRIGERYRLSTLLGEYDIRQIREFDPRDAIKKGLFKGATAILTGNLYPSNSVSEVNSNGSRHVSYRGGIDVVLRMIDVTDADIVGNATEHIVMNPVVEEWINKNIRRR